MTVDKKAVLFKDHIGRFPAGQVFYPESLKLINTVIAELNSKEMEDPEFFNNNIQFYLNMIIGHFESIHDTHNVAKTVYEQYRVEGYQYCLYLRSFVFSGMTLHIGPQQGKLESTEGFTKTDRNVRQFIKKALKNQINSLSFVNIYDVYPSDLQKNSDYMRDVTIPSFRVLSHNWREIVRETIRGAKLIVMNLGSETEGVGFEIDTIRECEMAQRTVVMADKLRDKHSSLFSDFNYVMELNTRAPDWQEKPEALRLKDRLEYLSNDDFIQTNKVQDLSDLECYLVDKNIDLAASQFDPEVLLDIAYEDYIPSSLANNWQLLSHYFPKLVADWQKIEDTAAAGPLPEGKQVAEALYLALATFYLAVTLERYQEMAVSIATLGIAHRAITRRVDIMADCYGHAAKCSGWAGNLSSAKYYSDICEELTKQVHPTENSQS